MIENRSDKKLRILEPSKRRGEVSKIAAGRTEPEKALPRPDPEVPAKATRRRFSARYKLRVLEQADGCEESGEVVLAITRKCGILNWRRGGVRDLPMGSLGRNPSTRQRFFFAGNGSTPWEEESRAAPQ